jgi:hypothetical protein
VTKIDRDKDGIFVVTIKGSEPLRAHSVVLAMPRRSLELLQETPFWNMDRVVRKEGEREIKLMDYVRSVIPYPAFKLFLGYNTPWWRRPPVSIAAGRSVSDLPIRQTYYFPPIPKPFPPPESGSDLLNGPCLVMASYDDLGAVSYWRALEVPEDEKPDAKEMLGRTLAAMQFQQTPSSFQDHVNRINDALTEEHGFYYAPAEMIRHAQVQLQYLHFSQPLPDPMPIPNGKPGELLAAYKDWGHDPYGGGWNFWAPRVNVKRMMEGIRKPFENANMYIVGEAYSGNQGWVEGALTTAEKVLREYFQLKRADWQPENAYLGY